MEVVYVCFEGMILYFFVNLALAKPFDEEKSSNDDNKLHCIDSNEATEFGRSNVNSFSEYYKPRSRFESSEKLPSRPWEYKRSASREFEDNIETNSLEKRQVGVVYRDDRPIGILQPSQRSYRFIPVRDDVLYGFDDKADEFSYNLPSVAEIDKRETGSLDADASPLDETYPSILTNFKIVNKLDKKRNYDALTEENVRDLKATIRRLRSANGHNNEQIEEELKSILDDMGLIEDEELHGEKREIKEEQLVDDMEDEENRRERFDPCSHTENIDNANSASSEHSLFNTDERKSDSRNDILNQKIDKRESTHDYVNNRRLKRQKEEVSPAGNKATSKIIENLKESGDLMFSGNKSPLASNSEVEVRQVDNKDSEKYKEDEDYEKRVERQIQSKINSLKEEVKREIEALKGMEDYDDGEMQRKKRQVLDNLINEETKELDPTLHPDNELIPLVRKRRNTISFDRKKYEAKFFQDGDRRKRKSENVSEIKSDKKVSKAAQEENDEGGDLLGDDFEDGVISKRQIPEADENFEDYTSGNKKLNDLMYERNERSADQPRELGFDDYFYYPYFYNKNRKITRNVQNSNSLQRSHWKPRLRRRINEDVLMPNRPQQLSDMSDLDLFGALPKSYDGELSRYKRVKRK